MQDIYIQVANTFSNSDASAALSTHLDVRPEVDEDVNNEHDVHDEVHHVERGAGVDATLHGWILLKGEKRLRR